MRLAAWESLTGIIPSRRRAGWEGTGTWDRRRLGRCSDYFCARGRRGATPVAFSHIIAELWRSHAWAALVTRRVSRPVTRRPRHREALSPARHPATASEKAQPEYFARYRRIS